MLLSFSVSIIVSALAGGASCCLREAKPSKKASIRFFICASDTTRRSIMSDSMNRLGISRAAISARRLSAMPVEVVRQLLMGW